MNTKKIVVVLFLILETQMTLCGWSVLNSGTTVTLYSVFMVNQYTGFISGDSNHILKTTNAGLNWFKTTPNGGESGISKLSDIYFRDINTGIVCGYIYLGITPYCIVKNTTNGGTNWSLNYIAYSCSNNSLCFPIPETGYIVGGDCIYKSGDGGNNWNQIVSLDNMSTSVYFINMDTGYVAGYDIMHNVGTVYKTINGGSNWTRKLYMQNRNFSRIKFFNHNTGIVIGAGGTILKTTNEGENWFIIASNIQSYLSDIETRNSGKSYIVSANVILKSNDFGTSWFPQISNTSHNLFSIYFINDTIGYAVGNNGIVLKTIDGGGPIGIIKIDSEIPSQFQLYQNYPNPFNSSTSIRLDARNISVSGETGIRGAYLKIIIYDALGRETDRLINEVVQPGIYKAEWDADRYASGIYYYRLIASDPVKGSEIYVQTRKMVLLK